MLNAIRGLLAGLSGISSVYYYFTGNMDMATYCLVMSFVMYPKVIVE